MKNIKGKGIIFVVILAVAVSPFFLVSGEEYQPQDEWPNHKMHYPQLPDPNGWDVNLELLHVGDDWQCNGTGYVKDIYFWMSWASDIVGEVFIINVSIWSNNVSGVFGYSEPDEMLWAKDFYDFEFNISGPLLGLQGFMWDPWTNEPDNHLMYYRVDMENISNPFYQESGTIYWLVITIPQEFVHSPGWKTSNSTQFMDDAVWSDTMTMWYNLSDPETDEPLDLAFVIAGDTNYNISVDKTVWNGTGWTTDYNNSSLGEELTFNISIHNTGDNFDYNITLFDTHYDALQYYVPNSSYITYANGTKTQRNPDSVSWENGSCEYEGHGHLRWNLEQDELVGFSYCNYIYIEFNMTVNSTNRSMNFVNASLYDEDYWTPISPLCYDIGLCYVNVRFNTSILCDKQPESSNWTVSEHVYRPCTEPECLDEEWFEYESEFEKWYPYNTSVFGSENWGWVYRYSSYQGDIELEGEVGTDSLGISYTIANNSCANRSQSLARIKYNYSSGEEGETTLLDSYNYTEQSTALSLTGSFPTADGKRSAGGQTFDSPPERYMLTQATFYMKKVGNPTDGLLYAELYETSGGKPSGAYLARSISIACTSLSSSYTLKNFTFYDDFCMESNHNYAILVKLENFTDSIINYVQVGWDWSAPSHSGNAFYYQESDWRYSGDRDVCFYVYGQYPTTDLFAGIIYSYVNHTHFDSALFSYGVDVSEPIVALISKRNETLYNTVDMSQINCTCDVINYWDEDWSTNTTVNPLDLDLKCHGGWIKLIYNEHSGHVQVKGWENEVHDEPAGWIYDNEISAISSNESSCFGLMVWNPRKDYIENFDVDFDFIEEWRLNYSRDENASASQLENHSCYGSDGIPLIYFPAVYYSPIIDNWFNDFYNDCYEKYQDGDLTTIEYADCAMCYFRNLSRYYNMESRAFDKEIGTVGNKWDNQKDNIYYYTTTFTNLTGEAQYNNSLYIQIEDCTDGSDNDYWDGALIAIDVDNNLVWDDNDIALYWYTFGNKIRYCIYNGTAIKHYGNTSDWDPDMDIWFDIEFTNNTYEWYDEMQSFFPPLHRYSPHRVYWAMIPIYYLEKGSVGSGNYLNANDTFGLHILTTNNDYEACPVWENWNETDESYYTSDDNGAASIWNSYMNCTTYDEIYAFEEGIWNGVNISNMQYWGHGRIGDECGTLVESRYSINATKEANVSIINDTSDNVIVNYTIRVCNNGDIDVTNITVNDTLPSGVIYIDSSLPSSNVTNPSGNIYIFNVSDSIVFGGCISFDVTVNFTANCADNGSTLLNIIEVTTNESADAESNHSMQYGSNHAPVITDYNPIFDMHGTSLLLVGINVTIEDDDGDSMDVYFYTNKSSDTWNSVWNAMGENISVNNGTYLCNQTFNNSQTMNTRWRWGDTTYYWWINVTDSKIWTNVSYMFVTDGSRYDVNTDTNVNVLDLSVNWNRRTVAGHSLYYGLFDVNADTNVNALDLSLIWAYKS